MKILYKTDTKGKQRYLKIYTKGAELIQESGVIGSDKPITHSKVCTVKNKGKSNETTAEDQAVLQMNSKVAEKLKEGYFDTLCAAKKEKVIMPMLAKSYAPEKSKIDWSNAYSQPKFDGMRCLAFIKNGQVTLMSRKGTEINGLDHIREELKELSLTESTLDGELYYHGGNFQENMRLIKKYRPGETEKIQFHIYDEVSDASFSLRHDSINSILLVPSKSLVKVKTRKINSEKDLIEHHKEYLKEGYEGSMVRWGNDEYKVNGRSSNLLKYKDFQDITATIIDIEPAEQRPEWGVPVLKYSNKKLTGVNEFEFRAGTKMSHEDRKDLLKNKQKYIGKTAEIRFFEYSEDGIPRFPVMVGIRLDK